MNNATRLLGHLANHLALIDRQGQRLLDINVFSVLHCVDRYGGVPMVGCGDDNRIVLWRASDGAIAHILEGHDAKIMSVRASADGALIATALLALAATRTQSVVTLILIGVGLSSFSGALMSLLMNLAPNPFSLADMINWMLGSVANRSFDEIGLALPFIGGGVALLLATRRGLSALTLGEEAASGVGLNLQHQRIWTVLGAGLATGGSVALAGAIGFVGIVAPHVVRPFVKHDPARSLIPSALLAGLILVIADIFVRILPSTNELKLGVVAALIGAPAFVWIAMQRRAGHD